MAIVVACAILSVFCFQTAANTIVFDEVLHQAGAPAAVQRATAWLLSKRNSDWGWSEQTTPDVLFTLQLANRSWFSTDNLESQLSVKQLEMETAIALWSRHHDNPLRVGRVAKLVSGLVSVCRDPRAFYGHDLVEILRRLDTGHPYEYSLVMQALCNAGTHIRKKQLRRLVSTLTSEEMHNHDTLAMTALAINCIAKDHHNRNLSGYMRRHSKRLKKLQHKDGSFGNIHTTGLTTEALMSMDDDHSDWNFTKAVEYMLQQQQADGGFGNILATLAVLPSLSGRTRLEVTNATCHDVQRASKTVTPIPHDQVEPVENEEPVKPISVKYSLWIGTNVTDNYTLTLNVPANTTFYDIMKRAAELDERFEFTASLWPNGHYVHTISGMKEDRTENKYWMAGLNNNPPTKPIFIDSGVDEYLPQDGDHVLFWYKKI